MCVVLCVLCVHVVLCMSVSCWCVHVVLCVDVVLCVVVSCCGVCVCLCLCACGVCVLCVLCGVSVGCVVCVVCSVWCWWSLARGKPPCVSVQNASVCTVRTSPCVPATGPNVQDIRACCRYTRRRPHRTHGGVLNVHTGGFTSPLLFSSLIPSLLVLSFSSSLLLSCLSSYMSLSLFFLLFSLFSFLLYLLFHLLFLHTQRRDQTDKWLHQLRTAMHRDPLNQERAINLSILAMSLMGSSRVLSQIKPQAPLLVVPFPQCRIFMFNVLPALPGFTLSLSQERYCISKN